MPVYEHECTHHGVFNDLRPFSQSGAKAKCPTCGEKCAKIFSLPQLRAMDPSMVKAHDRNERSKVEPHVCSSGCSHNHGKSKSVSEAKKKAQQQNGIVYKGPRPWVIEHA